MAELPLVSLTTAQVIVKPTTAGVVHHLVPNVIIWQKLPVFGDSLESFLIHLFEP